MSENSADKIETSGDAAVSAAQASEKPSVDSILEYETDAVKISAAVIAMIARTATLNVPGVVALHSSFMEKAIGLFIGSSEGAGIKVEMDENNVAIKLRISAAYGVRIPDVVRQVQNDIRRNVESITGRTVRTVNVIVQTIKPPSKEKSEESL
jgi:uncharacterized alkaline shock family protein YloU